MCKYKDDAPHERCTDGGVEIISRKVCDQADKDAIVQKHNDLRARVANGDETLGKPEGTGQPKASNMRQLVWNDELAEVALRSRVANGEETLGEPEGTGQPKASNMRQLVW